MPRLNAQSLTDSITAWLIDSQQARLLHIFDRACNLLNEHGEILAVVTPQIGNGPFNLVVETDLLLAEALNLESPIAVSADQLNLGDLTIYTSSAKLWNPQPDWKALHAHSLDIRTQLTRLATPDQPFPAPLISPFVAAVAHADIPAAKANASKIAGLGIGLTPAGDDFLMGALYAVWLIHPSDMASVLAQEIAETAAPLTTSLSAAWLRAAGQGEAGSLWHEFFAASVSGNMQGIDASLKKMLDVGETSGADALSGFLAVLTAYKEEEFTIHENSSR